MASKIESYNSSYPAAYYTMGTVYAFYGRKTSSGSPAPEKYIHLYASALRDLETVSSRNAIQPVKNGNSSSSGVDSGMTRFYAVVVAKSASSIEVMFLNDAAGEESFMTRKYTVSGYNTNGPCEYDGKNLMAPSARTSASGTKGSQQKAAEAISVSQRGKTGGITRSSTAAGKVGGITRARNNASSGVIGGITKAGQAPAVPGKTGGITRIKK